MDGWMEIAKGISLLIHINYNTDIQFIFLFNDVAMLPLCNKHFILFYF